jgi:hypothetical protein
LVGDIRSSKGHDCTALVLMHKIGETEDEVMTSKLGAGSPAQPIDYAKMFMNAAEDDAHDLPGSQQYCIKAFFGKDEHEGRHVFQVFGKGQAEDGYVSEGPDPRGQKMQGMRTAEMIFQLSWKQAATMMQSSQDIISHQNKMLVEAMSENREMLMVMKELVLAQAKVDHELRLAEINAERNAKMMSGLIGMAPPLANTLFGKEVFPQGFADSKMLESIAEGIEDEAQLGALQMFLKPELAALVTNRLLEIMRAKRKEKEALASAAMVVAKTNGTAEHED